MTLLGTVSVTNADATFVWTGAPLTAISCPVGSTIYISGLAYTVLSLTNTTTGELTRNYAESTGSGKVAEIDPLTDAETSTGTLNQRTATLIQQLSILDANGRGLWFNIHPATGANDPGPTWMATDNADPALVTELYFDILDANNQDVTAVIDLWTNDTVLTIRSIETNGCWTFKLTQAATNEGPNQWRKIVGVTYLDTGGGGVVDGEAVAVEWNRTGVDGRLSAVEIIKTSAYTALSTDVGKTIILNKATADTLSFQAAASLGSTWMIIVQNIGAGIWTLDPNGSELIDGLSTITLGPNESVVISCNGTALRTYFRNFTYYTPATTAGPSSLVFLEDLDNGVNKISVQAPAALPSDFTLTLPSVTGTMAAGPSTTVDNVVVRYDGVAGLIQASTVVIDDTGNVSGVGTLDASGAISMTFQQANTFAGGLKINKRGTTGNANAAITSGSEIGFHSFYGWDGTTYGRGAYVIASASQNWTGSAWGCTYSINTTPNGSTTNTRAVFIDQDQQVYFDKGARSTSGGIGYATGAGGTVTQATNKSTGVTLSKSTGQITMNGAALAANTEVTFTLTNTVIEANDILVFNHSLTAKYIVNAVCAAGSAAISVRNVTAGSLSEALVIKFALIKAVTS